MRKFKIWGISLLALLAIVGVLFLYWPLHQRSVPAAENDKPVDVVLVGGGIMSITLATYLQELQPDLKVQLFERLDGVALESSNGWNNAGTGHSAFAELNYTPELPDGSIETKRAVGIAEQFEISRQFWSHQVKEGRLSQPSDFINPTPHMSFVWGEDRVEYLRKRYEALSRNPLFYGMQFSTDPAQIKQWAPLVMEGRDPAQKVAATYMPLGTDVNFGVITNQLTRGLQRNPNFQLQVQHEVTALRQGDDKIWNVTVKDLKNGTERTVKSRFVFIGAGGAAVKLLQMSGIPEAKNYAGFPVGGQFLAFKAPALAERHKVKVYGMAETGSPPMSVPHIDARKLDDKPVVLFGPFALFSTKFLKEGSWFDLFSSVTHDNVGGMLKVGSENLDLVKYLMQQAKLTDEDRHAELLKYYPNAKREDWELITAGQRVQIIKNDPEKGPLLQFGTEIVTDKDKTIAALLGASPGASTSPPIMLNLLAQAFPQEMAAGWETKLKDIVPSYGRKINESAALTNEIRTQTSQALGLPYIEVPVGAQGAAAAAAAAPATPSPAAPASRNANTEMQAL
ncbi:malate dehydrogenase (quinone) [Comamonas endophytica]|uniref:Probable malate:quinone oxidoreductase n=1 Tax=Comamonas endophytica TaxID=2949090 RepID=A0ABY6G989_9BURK|nr:MULTISPECIES: malate dehydrogenase (quinone) [unclassified Acidovorax]MCD2511747.1 malate dehydrogenase (quinone) [Acidovorax sp. D4N7]UYG51471.1 malate dehydrogenase (quinone) [Acidovorax sp. 5MLIR]